jgi:Zn-finger protein
MMATEKKTCGWGTCDGEAVTAVEYPDGTTLHVCEACAVVAREEVRQRIIDQVRDIAGCAWDDREDRTSPLADQIRAVAAIPAMGTDGDLTDEDRAELRRLAQMAE